MKKLMLFYLGDCNVSKVFEERVDKGVGVGEFGGRFNVIRYNVYSDSGREEGGRGGISDGGSG